MKFGVGVDYCLKALIVLASANPNVQPQRVEEIAASKASRRIICGGCSSSLSAAVWWRAKKVPTAVICWRAIPRKLLWPTSTLIEGDYVPVECLEESSVSSPCHRGEARPMRTAWCEIRDSVNAILNRTTLQSLAERRKSAIHFQI